MRGLGLGVGVKVTPHRKMDYLAAATYDLNFRAAAYKGGVPTDFLQEVGNYVGGLYEREDTGALQSVGASVLQITANGIEVWPTRVNAVTQKRDLSNAAWQKVNVTALRNQVGRNGAAGGASRIVSTANNGTILLPLTLASSVRRQSADVKRLTGTGTLEMTMDGGTTWTVITPAGVEWVRASIPSQTLANPSVGFRIGTNGDAFAIDYVQNENGPTVSPRIAIGATADTRPQCRATSLNKAPLNDLIKTQNYTAYWEGKIDALSGRGLFVSDGGFTVAAAVDGSIAALGVPAGEFKFGIYQKVAFSRINAGTTKASVNGGPIRTGSLASHAALTHFDIATNGAGTSNGWGIVKRIAFWNSIVPEEGLIRVTS
jgi:hypothetical protein